MPTTYRSFHKSIDMIFDMLSPFLFQIIDWHLFCRLYTLEHLSDTISNLFCLNGQYSMKFAIRYLSTIHLPVVSYLLFYNGLATSKIISTWLAVNKIMTFFGWCVTSITTSQMARCSAQEDGQIGSGDIEWFGRGKSDYIPLGFK